ncbi:MAG: ABC transporter permease [Puniceicoccales bacterium]|jgi:ABC-type transport system involved in multi-copper enzyme maturation permease subunit|nr:ABC transporter permease [Puniceicoccales bacterium]
MTDSSLLRVRWIAGNTFVEALRQRFFAFLFLLAAGLAASGMLLRTFNFGQSELKFIADFGFGAMFLFGSILAIVMTVQLFFSELDNRTALTLLAKPVRRWEFVLGKFLGIWTLLGVFIALLGVVLAVMLSIRMPELVESASRNGEPLPFLNLKGLGMFCLLQWFRLGVVAALSLMICSFAQTFLYAVIVSAMGILLCQVQSAGVSAFSKPDQETWVRTLANGVGKVIPDLQLFDLGVPLVLSPAGAPQSAVLSALGYGALYMPVLLFITVFLFSDREI